MFFAKGKPRVELIIPGLLNLPLYELDLESLKRQTPNLHRLIRFADRLAVEEVDFDQTLIHLLELQQSALPYATAFQKQRSGQALLFKPVHLKSDINNAIVFPVEEDSDNIKLLINDLSDFFKKDCDIENVSDNLWLMQIQHCSPVKGVPHYLSAVGKKVTNYIEQSKANLDWFKLFNEMQMFLYQHPVNQQRLQTGQPVINSLWCWGGDGFQGETHPDLSWFSDVFELQSLGRLYSNHVGSLTDIPSSKLKNQVVVIDLSILNALKSGQDVDLFSVLEKTEENCLAPLSHLNFHALRIHTASSTQLLYRKHHDYRFWKKGTWSVAAG